MCDECGRLQEKYSAAAKRLLDAQRELARHDANRSSDSFNRLWRDCQEGLNQLWQLREEMATHAAGHGTNTMSSNA